MICKSNLSDKWKSQDLNSKTLFIDNMLNLLHENIFSYMDRLAFITLITIFKVSMKIPTRFLDTIKKENQMDCFVPQINPRELTEPQGSPIRHNSFYTGFHSMVRIFYCTWRNISELLFLTRLTGIWELTPHFTRFVFLGKFLNLFEPASSSVKWWW